MLIWFAETTIVAGILALVAIALGKRREIAPSFRHALWLVVLIKFVTPPLVSWPWATEWHALEWPAAWHQTARPVALAGETAIAPIPDVVPAQQVSDLQAAGDNDFVQVEAVQATQPVELTSALSVNIIEKPDEVSTAEVAAEVTPIAATDPVASLPAWLSSKPLSRGLLIAWLTISVTIAIGQIIRIVRFRRRLRGAFPAPDFLIDEADRIGRWLGVTVPEILTVDDLGTPMLWCLGRPQLLLPTRLVKTLPLDRWRGILTHELAHLRRHDQWVSRLELAAGLIWWWNPLYWLARARLDAEAELACDAWVVWALPKDRLTYAEVLFDICSTLSVAKPMAPMLSVAGSGRFFERRLTMILHNDVPCRLSPMSFFGACLLVLCALPTWSAAKLVSIDPDGTLSSIPVVAASGEALDCVSAIDDDDKDGKAAKRPSDDADDDDADDDDDDDDDDDADDDDEQDEKALERAKAKEEAAKAKVEAIKAKIEAARARGDKKAKAKDKASKAKKADKKGDVDIDTSKLEKEIESKFGKGSDFEKQMEKLGEEMEKKFGEGSDFEKQMENLGKEIASKFGDGSDFAKKMEEFGKELEAKLGEGSDFFKKIEGIGKELEAKLGPGSEFEKKMKELGEEMKEKYGPDSDFAKKLEKKAADAAKAKAKAGVKAEGGAKERRIKELEEQVAKLIEQIDALRAQDKDDNKN
jgi:beta-lactamase regulating signal transducer with metallopeptidase domain